MLYKNGEGYTDKVAGAAIREADKPPEQVTTAIRRIKTIAHWHGFEICGRIWLKDTKTGKEYR